MDYTFSQAVELLETNGFQLGFEDTWDKHKKLFQIYAKAEHNAICVIAQNNFKDDGIYPFRMHFRWNPKSDEALIRL